jgi:hypothetical protein
VERVTGKSDTAEAAIRENDQVIAGVIVSRFGARRATGGDCAVIATAHVVEFFDGEAHLILTPLNPR